MSQQEVMNELDNKQLKLQSLLFIFQQNRRNQTDNETESDNNNSHSNWNHKTVYSHL